MAMADRGEPGEAARRPGASTPFLLVLEAALAEGAAPALLARMMVAEALAGVGEGLPPALVEARALACLGAELFFEARR